MLKPLSFLILIFPVLLLATDNREELRQCVISIQHISQKNIEYQNRIEVALNVPKSAALITKVFQKKKDGTTEWWPAEFPSAKIRFSKMMGRKSQLQIDWMQGVKKSGASRLMIGDQLLRLLVARHQPEIITSYLAGKNFNRTFEAFLKNYKNPDFSQVPIIRSLPGKILLDFGEKDEDLFIAWSRTPYHTHQVQLKFSSPKETVLEIFKLQQAKIPPALRSFH